MKATQELGLKVFLQSAIMFGGLNWIFNYLFFSRILQPLEILISMLLFGLIMAFLLVGRHVKKIRDMGYDSPSASTLKVHQSKEITTPHSREEILQLLKANEFKGRINTANEGNLIAFKTPASINSWGEKIKIQFLAPDNHPYQVKIESRPLFPLTLVDLGKNLKNVDEIADLIS